MTKLHPLLSWRSAICDSSLEATTRHVALTLSLYMNERGASAHPGAQRLAHDSALSERSVRDHLAKLVEAGWLRLEHRGGRVGERRHANAYAAVIPAARSGVTGDNPGTSCTREPPAPVNVTAPTPADDDTDPCSTFTPSLQELSKNSPTKPKRASARVRDPLWDAFAAEVGYEPKTTRERGAWNGALKELREAGATGEQVHQACAAARDRWQGRVTLTLPALAKHWSSLLNGTTAKPQSGVAASFAAIERVLGPQRDVIDVQGRLS